MAGGTRIRNHGTDPVTLPFPLAGVLTPGQAVSINVPRANVVPSLLGITPGNALRTTQLPPGFTGPYDTAYQGYLNADGTISLPAGDVAHDATLKIASGLLGVDPTVVALLASPSFTGVPVIGGTPTVGDGTGQTNFRGGAKTANRTFSSATNSGTCNGLITDYIVSWTETTTNNSIYQAIAMGAVPGQRVPLIIKDESYSGAFGTPNTKTITVKPLAGKKLNNVVNGTLVILNGGGVVSVEIDDGDNMHQLGFTP